MKVKVIGIKQGFIRARALADGIWAIEDNKLVRKLTQHKWASIREDSDYKLFIPAEITLVWYENK